MKDNLAFWATIIGGIVAVITVGIWLYQIYFKIIPPEKLPKRYRWRRIGSDEFHRANKSLYALVKQNFVPDIIIGCSRGGAVVGGIISKHFQVPMAFIDFSSRIQNGEKKYSISAELGIDISNKKILIVDDAPHSGKMLLQALGYIRKYKPSEIKTAVIIAQENSNQSNAIKQRATLYSPDYYVFYTNRNDYKMPYEE